MFNQDSLQKIIYAINNNFYNNVDLLLSMIDVDLLHDTDKQSAALENYFFRTTIPIIR